MEKTYFAAALLTDAEVKVFVLSWAAGERAADCNSHCASVCAP